MQVSGVHASLLFLAGLWMPQARRAVLSRAQAHRGPRLAHGLSEAPRVVLTKAEMLVGWVLWGRGERDHRANIG